MEAYLLPLLLSFAMLEVSGVGQNKLMKYGQRFVNEIDTFVKEHKGMAATIN